MSEIAKNKASDLELLFKTCGYYYEEKKYSSLKPREQIEFFQNEFNKRSEQIKWHTFLDCNHSPFLTGIPPQIGLMTNLRTLNLSNTKISTLPSQISQLTSLNILLVNGDHEMRTKGRLKFFPPELGCLSQLWGLYAMYNQLTSLPSEMAQLINLKSLDLSNNEISSLSQIWFSKKMKTLNLGYNRISIIPSGIGLLTQLVDLNLTQNQISALPIEIFDLTNLTMLGLANNKLEELYPEIGELQNLKSLYLEANRIKHLPEKLGKCTNLVQLNFADNPLEFIPEPVKSLPNLDQPSRTEMEEFFKRKKRSITKKKVQGEAGFEFNEFYSTACGINNFSKQKLFKF